MKLKKFLFIIVIFAMLASLFTVCAYADTKNSITINFAAYDGMSNTFLYIPEALTVTEGIAEENGYGNAPADHEVGGVDHGIGDGEISALDAVVAAHLKKDGDVSGISGESSYLTGMFGISGYIGFLINGNMPVGTMSDGYAINEYALKDGETVLLFSYGGEGGFEDFVSYFDKTELTVNENEEFSLYLEGYEAMKAMWMSPGTPTAEFTKMPVSCAEICLLNTQTGALEKTGTTTDENGNFTYSFDKAGEYILTATATLMGSYGEAPVIAPMCHVTVTEPKRTYDVTVKVGTSDINVDFYKCAGYDDDGYDILGENISVTDNGVSDSYHVYTMKLEKGTYSYRAKDADGNSLGGMTFDVPAEKDLDNSEASSTEIVLRLVDIYTTTKLDGVYADETQYSTEVMDNDGRLATAGAPYVSTYARYPYLLYANGNAELYTVSLIPSEEVSNNYNLGTNVIQNCYFNAGATKTTKSGALVQFVNAVITAPKDSKVQVFNQIKNFYTQEVSYTETEASGENICYTYRLPQINTYTYRVSMDGKITKAGYLDLKSDASAKTDIVFSENENPKIRPDYDTSTKIGSRLEDNIVLNINSQNYLRMKTGETFKARAYRAWQIINTDTSNIMIEPDFEYKIISGDSVTLSQEGQNAVIKAEKEGISIIEVTYNAIEIGGNTLYTGIYGAVDPMRKGLFVVNVDGNTDTQITIPKWDSDFDTVYFLEETGTYNFKPVSDGVMTVMCNDVEICANNDGSYTLPLNQGNNIVSVTAGDTVEYIVIKGKRITVNITNQTSPDKPVKQGDTVNISFEGIYMPIPKFSGIYNPGFGGTIKAAYTNSDGEELLSAGAQYDFINNNTISFTAKEKGAFKLNNGHIALTCMGYAPGSHREITDFGIGSNFNAPTSSYSYSVLPDISFEVKENTDASYIYGISEKNVSYSDGNITLYIVCEKEIDLNIYIASLNDSNSIDKALCITKKASSGENTIPIDYSEFADLKNVKLFVWDKYMKPVFDVTDID